MPESSSPLFGIVGCLVWIPLGVWIILLCGWMITAEVEAWVAILGIGVAVGVGMLAFNPPNQILPPFLFLASTGTLVLAPIARFALNKAEIKSVDYDSMERAYELLGQSPNNIGGKLRMARALYNQGHVALAAEIGENAIKGLSKDMFQEDFRAVAQWRSAATGKLAPTVLCVRCGHPNGPTNMFCAACGTPHLLDYVRGRSVDPDLKSKILAGWFVAMLALVGIPAATSLPAGLAIVAIVVLLFASLIMLRLVWMRSERAV